MRVYRFRIVYLDDTMTEFALPVGDNQSAEDIKDSLYDNVYHVRDVFYWGM